MKHTTCVGCHAHFVMFPHAYLHVMGRAVCTLGFPVQSASIDSEHATTEEAIPLEECPRPPLWDFEAFKKAYNDVKMKEKEKEEQKKKHLTSISGLEV